MPGVGRFLTQDPVGQKGGLNLYGYCEDNPLTKIDPDGKQGLSLDSVRASISAAMRQATTDPRAAVQSLQELGKLSGITAATSNLIQRRIEQINLQISLQHTHHYLPQRYLAWFNARGINIENYTYRINAELHRIIHGKFVQGFSFPGEMGKTRFNWNSEWAVWISQNPNAKAQEIANFANELATRTGIPNIKYR